MPLVSSLAVTAGAQTVAADAPVVKAGAVTVDTVTITGQRTREYVVPDSAAATKLTLTPRETPQSLTVITRERLDDQNLTSLRQVLDDTAGIYSNAYDSERVLFYSRGFLVDTLMYDGVPAISNFNTSSIDETVDTAMFERIEVVRGATGLMTGAGSPAASINLVRKHADSRVPTISADLGLSSWRGMRAEIDGTMPLSADGSIRARVVAVGEDDHSYQDLYHKKKTVLYGIVDADLSAATKLSLGFDYQDNRPRGNTWGSFPLFLSDGSFANWPRSVTTATDWTFWNRRTETLFGELNHVFDNGWSLRVSGSHRRYNEDLALFYMYGFPDPATGTGLTPSAYRSDAQTIENALDVYATGPFELLGRKHELVVGYGGSRARNTGNEFEPPDPLPDPGNFFRWDGSYPMPAFATEATRLQDITTTQQGLYAAARLSLADPLKLILGARYARWKVDSFYLYDDPNDSSYDYRRTIPYAGLVWDVSPNYSAFASYTSIFKPQNARDIDGHYLPPIDGRSMEVGLKGEHIDKRMTTSLTLFDTRQNNVAQAVVDAGGNPVLLPDGTQVSQAVSGTRTRGFEAEVSGRLTSELQAYAGWTRYSIHDGQGQAFNTFIPDTQVRLFATWEPKRWIERLKLGAGMNWQSATTTSVARPIPGTDGTETEPYTLGQGSVLQVSLMARYEFSPHVALQFNASNLFDRRYYVLDQYDNTYYGAPASYALTLHLAY